MVIMLGLLVVLTVVGIVGLMVLRPTVRVVAGLAVVIILILGLGRGFCRFVPGIIPVI